MKEQDKQKSEKEEVIEEKNQKPIWATASSLQQSQQILSTKEEHDQKQIRIQNEKSILSDDEGSQDQQYQTTLYKKTKGDYTQEYQKLKRNVEMNEEISQQEIANIKAQLLINKIKIHTQNIGDECLVEEVIRHSQRIFEIRIRMGIFSVQISVFSLSQVNYETNKSKLNNSENKIKFKQYLFENQVICQKFESLITAETIPYNIKKSKPWFLMVLKELAFTKIFSVLKIGPKFCTPFGFDLIRYKNGLAFNIQKCYEIQVSQPTQKRQKSKFQYRKVVYRKDLNDLKRALTIMHGLKILHADIKQQNIMYSISWEKCVFIDFGITSCVKQKTHQGTKMKGWMGPGYILSEDMQMYELKQYGKNRIINMNFYINDLKLFATFLGQCHYQNNPSHDPYLNKILNFYDPYQNAFQQIIQQKKIINQLNFIELQTDLLWVRFFYNFYIGNLQKIKNEILTIVNNYESNFRNCQILMKLNELLQKTGSEIQKCFQVDDFNPRILQFLNWYSEVRNQYNQLCDLNANHFIQKSITRTQNLVESIFFSNRKRLIENKDLLIQDLVSNCISLVDFYEKNNPSILKPNFYEVQRYFLNKSSAFLTANSQDKQTNQNKKYEEQDVNEIVEKYVFFISFRRRIGHSTLQNRQLIATYFNALIRNFPQFYFQIQLENTGLLQSYEIAQKYFNQLLEQGFDSFKHFLQSYWIILTWIFRTEKLKEIKNQNKKYKIFAIKNSTQILYNLALSGYYNQKLHVKICKWITQSFQTNSEIGYEGFPWIERINILLKLRQVRQIAGFTTNFHYLIKNQKVSSVETQKDKIQNFTSYNTFEKEYLGKYQQRNQSSKLQSDAVNLYFSFVQSLQNGDNVQKIKMMAKKSQKMLNQNPQQILLLYKIINVDYLTKIRIKRPAQFYIIIKKCKLYSAYEKEEPITQQTLKKLNLSQTQKMALKQKYKEAYFQPQMLVSLSYLKLMTEIYSSEQLLMYQRIDQIIWNQQLTKFIFLVSRLKTNFIQNLVEHLKLQLLKNQRQSNDQFLDNNRIQGSQIKETIDFSLIRKFKIHKAMMKTRNKIYSPLDVQLLMKTVQFIFESKNSAQSVRTKQQISYFYKTLYLEINEVITDFFSSKMTLINPGQQGVLQILHDTLEFPQIIVKSKCFNQSLLFMEDSTQKVNKNLLKEHFVDCQDEQKQPPQKSKDKSKLSSILKNISRLIQIKADQVNHFIRDATKSVDQAQNGQILHIILTVAQIRLDLHMDKYKGNLPKLIKRHEYIVQKLKKFPLLFSTVTQTIKDVNLNLYLFYMLDTFILCLETERNLIKQELNKISKQKISTKEIQVRNVDNIYEGRSSNLSQDNNDSGSIKYDQSQVSSESQNSVHKSYVISHKSLSLISQNSLKYQRSSKLSKKLKQRQKQPQYTQRQRQLNFYLNKIDEQLTQDNSWLNSTLLMLHENLFESSQLQIMFSKHIRTANQMCQIFITAIKEINSKTKNHDLSLESRWYKNIKNTNKQYQTLDFLISPKQQQIIKQETKVFECLWKFLKIITKTNFFHSSETYSGEIIQMHQICFRKLHFFNLLKFVDFIYKFEQISFQTNSQQNSTTSQNQNKSSILKVKAISFTFLNRNLPLVISLANQELNLMFDQMQNEKNKDFLHLSQIFKRNFLTLNFMFLRNTCLQRNQENLPKYTPIWFYKQKQDPQSQPDLLSKFINQKQQVSDKYQIEEKKNMSLSEDKLISLKQTSLSAHEDSSVEFLLKNEKITVNEEITSKKSINIQAHLKKKQIAEKIKKIAQQNINLAQISEHRILLVKNIIKYIQYLTDKNKDHEAQIQRIYQLILNPNERLLSDRHILLKIEFIHFYMIMTKDYKTFNYFFKLSDRINKNQLFSKVLFEINLSDSLSLSKMKWIQNYKRNKKRSNLFHFSRFSHLKELQKSVNSIESESFKKIIIQRSNLSGSQSKKVQNDQNIGYNSNYRKLQMLRKKSHQYKKSYTELLLSRMDLLN